MTPFKASALLPICGPGLRAQAFPMSYLPQTNKPQAHIPSTPDDGLCKPTTAGPAIQMPGFRHARMHSQAHNWGGGVRPCSKRVYLPRQSGVSVQDMRPTACCPWHSRARDPHLHSRNAVLEGL
ncbi:hypothetical protein B0J15DRAFT_164019 [Fusarium solani]|uniref:Uncharacterized protein n=1 Tax=Fusarium solani TaxID=169388 RepID=A0A9P9L0Y9_FUSSL|nr:uncharacterized protein B0J15DRAFT_164019 [Fusarium solani]KAH7271970.1 hypothetical protein B0J15DRAFT_164019 [Fusarium solani]